MVRFIKFFFVLFKTSKRREFPLKKKSVREGNFHKKNFLKKKVREGNSNQSSPLWENWAVSLMSITL